MDVLANAEAASRFGAHRVRMRIERGVWQRPCRGVVVTHNGPLTPDQQLAVALKAAPPGSALAGPTALRVDGFDAFDEPAIHLAIPHGSRRLSVPALVVHESRPLSDVDVQPNRWPRRTRPARSLVDLASWQSNERRARAIVITGIQQGLVSTRQLREALSRRGPCRHRGLIIESILDASGGVQSLPERDFGAIWLGTRLPPFVRQKRVRDGRCYLDVWCPALAFGVEIHGIPHLAVERWDADLYRANEILIDGGHLLAFSSYAIRRAPHVVADQLLRMAASRGWPTTDRPAFVRTTPQQRRPVRRAID